MCIPNHANQPANACLAGPRAARCGGAPPPNGKPATGALADGGLQGARGKRQAGDGALADGGLQGARAGDGESGAGGCAERGGGDGWGGATRSRN
jgi:hypothetical protein